MMEKATGKKVPVKTEVTEKRPRGRRVGSRQNPFAKRVDVHVGERLRERRSFMGYTQESLAQELKLSHQQVQKYETGANRISAGRLFELAKTLDVPIQYFFEGFDESLPAHTPKHGGTNRAAIEIAQNFNDIKDQTVRSTLSSLVKTLASHSREN
jgi:transcriptional regulator with XRE-family HTH domain